jgi:hypothetical protein
MPSRLKARVYPEKPSGVKFALRTFISVTPLVQASVSSGAYRSKSSQVHMSLWLVPVDAVKVQCKCPIFSTYQYLCGTAVSN